MVVLAGVGGWITNADASRLDGAIVLASENGTLQQQGQSAAAEPATQAASLTCTLGALGTPPVAHGVTEYFPAALAATISQTQDDATATARALASKFGGAPAPTSAVTAAREVSYAEFLSASGWPANPSINPQRCVWLVTVHAPMPIKVPPGRAPRTVDVYTVALDAGTGTLIGLLAGRDLIR
jgi:hypothetical protein